MVLQIGGSLCHAWERTAKTPARNPANSMSINNCDLQRLWMTIHGEIRKFWEALPPAEVTAWARGSDLVLVRVESVDGKWQEAFALPDIEARLAAIPPPA